MTAGSAPVVFHPERRVEDHGVGAPGGLCRAAPPAADEVDGGAQLEQGVAGGIDAVDAGYGVEDDALLLGSVVGLHGGESEGAELLHGTRFGPVDGGVVDGVALFGELDDDVEGDGAFREALGELIEEVVGRFGFGGGVVEVLVAGGGQDSVTAVATFSLLIDEAHGSDAVVALAGEAGGRGFGRLDECERSGVRAEEDFERRALEIGGIAGGERAEELEEFVAGVGGEAVGGVGDDVGVDVLGEHEADGEATWIGIGIVVRDERDAGGVRETRDDGCGRARDVRGAGELGGAGGRRECAAEQEALGVCGAKAGVEAEDSVELLEEVFAEGKELRVGGQGHESSPVGRGGSGWTGRSRGAVSVDDAAEGWLRKFAGRDLGRRRGG